MEEILNDTHNQEEHRDGQTGNSQHTQEGQTGFRGLEHGDQAVNGFRDPVSNRGKDLKNGIENISSSMQKHLLF